MYGEVSLTDTNSHQLIYESYEALFSFSRFISGVFGTSRFDLPGVSECSPDWTDGFNIYWVAIFLIVFFTLYLF